MTAHEMTDFRELSMKEIEAVEGGYICEAWETVNGFLNRLSIEGAKALEPIGPEIMAYVRSGA